MADSNYCCLVVPRYYSVVVNAVLVVVAVADMAVVDVVVVVADMAAVVAVAAAN